MKIILMSKSKKKIEPNIQLVLKHEETFCYELKKVEVKILPSLESLWYYGAITVIEILLYLFINVDSVTVKISCMT